MPGDTPPDPNGNGSLVHELDVVKLREQVGKWEPGTAGTVVCAYASSGLVEIVDHTTGGTLDMLAVPYSALDVVWSLEHEAVHHTMPHTPPSPHKPSQSVSARVLLARFIGGIGSYLVDLGLDIEGRKRVHPMNLTNGQIDMEIHSSSSTAGGRIRR